MLEVENLSASYGAVRALRGVSFRVSPGEVLAIAGPNGAGKSTLANALAGLHRSRSGRIGLDGRDLIPARTTETVRAGIALVPQGRRVFGSCTVAEHVDLARSRARPGALPLDALLAHFSRLRDRWSVRARQLSGGEQQMLAITRAVLLGPRVLILDEPTEGLAPAIVDAVCGLVGDLRDREVTIVLMEQPGPFAESLADRTVTIDRGLISEALTAHEGESS